MKEKSQELYPALQKEETTTTEGKGKRDLLKADQKGKTGIARLQEASPRIDHGW